MAGVKKYNIIDKLFEEAFDKYSGRGHDINWDSVLEYMQATNKSNYNITMDDLRDAARRTRRKDPHYGKKVLFTNKDTRPKSVEDLGPLPKQGQAYKLFDMDGHDKAKMLSGNIFFDNVYLDEFNQAIFNFIDEAGVPFQIMGDSTRQIDLYANKKNTVRDLNEIKNYQQNLFDIEDHLNYMTKELGLEQQSAYFDYNIKPLYEQVKQYETKYNVNPNKYTAEVHDKYRRQVKKNKLYDKETKEAANDMPDEIPNSNTTSDIPNTGEKAVEETVENMGDTIEETIENAAETVIKNVAEEAGEEAVETIIKQTTGVNVELDGLNKKRTPKKLKKGTKKYKGKTKELYDRLDDSRYWAVDFPGSNGDFAVHGPNGTKRLEKESIDQQRRRRKYEQTRQKYENKPINNTNTENTNTTSSEPVNPEEPVNPINPSDGNDTSANMNGSSGGDGTGGNDSSNTANIDDGNNRKRRPGNGRQTDIPKINKLDVDLPEAVREGGSISKYLDEFKEMGFIEKAMTLGNVAGAVSEYKDARRQGHGVISSVARAGVDFALGEAMGLYYPIFLLAKEAPGLIVKGSEMLYKENRKMNSMANQQIFGDAQFQDTQQLATMRQSGMEMAKMAQYNLQQTLMGQEATYLHR